MSRVYHLPPPSQPSKYKRPFPIYGPTRPNSSHPPCTLTYILRRRHSSHLLLQRTNPILLPSLPPVQFSQTRQTTTRRQWLHMRKSSYQTPNEKKEEVEGKKPAEMQHAHQYRNISKTPFLGGGGWGGEKWLVIIGVVCVR